MSKEKITSQNSAAEVDSSQPGKERRRALRTILAGGVLASGSEALPRTWTRPIVESVVLPVHAQTTGEDDEPEEDNGPIVTDCAAPTGCYSIREAGLYFNWDGEGGLLVNDEVTQYDACEGEPTGYVYARLVLAPDDASAFTLCDNPDNTVDLSVDEVSLPCRFWECVYDP